MGAISELFLQVGLLLQSQGPTRSYLGRDDTHLEKTSDKDIMEEGQASLSLSKVEDGR